MTVRYLAICLFCLTTNHFDLNAQENNMVSDLPLQLSTSSGAQDGLIIYVTGDGGWNSFNQQIVHELENNGYGVVALNSRKYFWSGKSPELFARDIELVAKYYMKEWGKSSLIIVGYSFGADVASFLSNRLSADLKKNIRKIALISPSASTDFEIRLSDLVGQSENINRKYKVGPEIEKTDLPIICIFGTEEEKVLKSSLKKMKNLIINELPGDHRYQNNFASLSQLIGI